MGDHRVRLDDYELGLVVGALRARASGVSRKRRAQLLGLAERLAEGHRGNPDWILGYSVTERGTRTETQGSNQG